VSFGKRRRLGAYRQRDSPNKESLINKIIKLDKFNLKRTEREDSDSLIDESVQK
jgi:hypothetical protein